MATGCAGIRTATVPPVSPRSSSTEARWRATTVSPPGQNAATSSRARSVTSTRPSRASGEPTSTGEGMFRPRPLAASRRATASAEKASAPTPYTVSVGSTTSSPRRTAATASRSPAARSDASEQSKRRVIRDLHQRATGPHRSSGPATSPTGHDLERLPGRAPLPRRALTGGPPPPVGCTGAAPGRRARGRTASGGRRLPT